MQVGLDCFYSALLHIRFNELFFGGRGGCYLWLPHR